MNAESYQSVARQIREILRSKFAVDSIFNLASVFVLGISGLLINLFIARHYGADALGVFNLVYAIYIVTALVGALGVPMSCLTYVSQYAEDPAQCGSIVIGALGVTLASATACAVALYAARGAVGSLMSSSDLTTGLAAATPGLWCFIINKVLMNVLNGLREMKAFAVFTMLRYVLICATVPVGAAAGLAGPYVPLCFTVGESVLLPALVVFLATRKSVSLNADGFREWSRRHLSFGLRSFLGGIFAELNTRVDVLMLGYLVSDRLVGIYSFSAMLIEGIIQLPYVLRLNMDPIITRLIVARQFDELGRIVRQGTLWSLLGMAVVGLLAIGAFPILVLFFVSRPEFMEGWIPFIVLMVGTVAFGACLPFSGILIQGGYPGLQTVFIICGCVVNITLNAVLIPLFGITGAAIATSLAFCSMVALLKVFTWYVYGIRI
ncbi:MAG: polysaccharide biosynthesis C-terminal domain-containing protein [Pseudomonadota bacterium]